ncbi:MAG TPA: histidine kinase [Desulfotomaculum sp.]|nr:histidine kinase [Desulfotomaculum sp.]
MVEMRRQISELKKLEIQRRRVEKKLQFERKQIKSVFDSLNELVNVIDPKTYKILYANKAINALYKKNLVGGTCYKEYYGLESPCEFCANEMLLKERGKTKKSVHFNPLHNTYYNRINKMIKWMDGQYVRFGMLTDITESKRTEKELAVALREREVIMETVSDIIYLFDLNMNLVKWNKKLEMATGLSSDELNGRSVIEFFAGGENRITAIRAIEEVLEKGQVKAEIPLLRKDKKAIPYEWTGALLKDEQENVLGVTGIGRDITERKQAEKELRLNLKKLQKVTEGVIKAMALIVETRDPHTAGHQQRVSRLAKMIAEEMGLPEEQIEAIEVAAAIHDIGKINIPAEILSKPGQITDIEFSLIKTHPLVGYNILKAVEFPWPIAQIVYQHHERINSSGYPSGLSEKDILLEARILAVADVVEAMSSHRPYRPALGINTAMEEISQNKGLLYDSKVADVCIELFTKEGFNF